jgi:membrane fusion protein (multidrug efflux system)
VIKAARTQGDNWVVTSGLKPGDRVIVEGGMLLRPGMAVKPTPFTDRPGAGAAAAPAQTP